MMLSSRPPQASAVSPKPSERARCRPPHSRGPPDVWLSGAPPGPGWDWAPGKPKLCALPSGAVGLPELPGAFWPRPQQAPEPSPPHAPAPSWSACRMPMPTPTPAPACSPAPARRGEGQWLCPQGTLKLAPCPPATWCPDASGDRPSRTSPCRAVGAPARCLLTEPQSLAPRSAPQPASPGGSREWFFTEIGLFMHSCCPAVAELGTGGWEDPGALGRGRLASIATDTPWSPYSADRIHTGHAQPWGREGICSHCPRQALATLSTVTQPAAAAASGGVGRAPRRAERRPRAHPGRASLPAPPHPPQVCPATQAGIWRASDQ